MSRRGALPGAAASPNRILSQNLAALIDPAMPITDAARQIGISRLKLSRFIQGTSFPRPNELAAICEAFGVDARIVLEPVAELRERREREGQMRALSEVLDRYPMRGVSPELEPGLYQIWRRALGEPSLYYRGLIQVGAVDGIKACRGFEPRTLYPDGTVTSTLRLRLFWGMFLDLDKGSRFGCLFIHNRPSSVATLSYFERVPEGNFFAGFGALTRAYSSDMIRFYGVVMQKVDVTPRRLVELAHRELFFGPEKVPPDILAHLDVAGFF